MVTLSNNDVVLSAYSTQSNNVTLLLFNNLIISADDRKRGQSQVGQLGIVLDWRQTSKYWHQTTPICILILEIK